MTESGPPFLVLIDVKNLTYTRFIGKTRVLKTQATELLAPHWVELFRTRPDLLTTDDPVPA